MHEQDLRPARRPARRPPGTRRPGAGRPRGSRGSVTFRLQAGLLVVAVVLSVFAGRLVQLQGLDPNSYAAMAAAEGTVTLTMPAARGDILDRNGEALADSVEGLMIVADPQLTAPQAPALAKLLSRRLDLDYFETLQRLRARDSRFQYVARQVPASTAMEVVADATTAGFPGLDTSDDPIRTYPGKDVAANLVGFLGEPTNQGKAVPLAGFEDTFDSWLAGTDGQARYQVGGGNRLPLGDSTLEEPRDGQDLSTTIDADLQWYVQRVLRDTVRSSGGESGMAIVMDTHSGEVLAMADDPTFDASSPLRATDDSLYASRAATDVYEPGSVEKVLTASALIDAGKVTMRSEFVVPGQLDRQDRVIGDWFDHGTLKMTLAGIIAQSSNIGTVLAADKFDKGQLRRYLSEFGLGRRTGVGVGGESAGILPRGAAWTSQVEDRVAFGQSVSVNALQMTAAVNTVANGGVRVDPSLIEGAARTDSGRTIGTDEATSRRVVSEEAAHETSLMMERVVDPEVGVAPAAAIPGYRVAGKTGTAQRVDPDCGCYDGSTTVSFGGFAPADDPRFTIYVAVQKPRAGSGGGSVAGPAFAKMMGYTLRRYAVQPTGTRPSRVPVSW